MFAASQGANFAKGTDEIREFLDMSEARRKRTKKDLVTADPAKGWSAGAATYKNEPELYSSSPKTVPPPEHTAAVESYITAELPCKYSVDKPKLLPSNLVSELPLEWCTIWSMELPEEPVDDKCFKNRVDYIYI